MNWKDWRILSGATLAAILGAAAMAWHAWLRPMPVGADRLVTVHPGSTARRIGDELRSAGVVRSGTVFYAWARATGAASELKAGQYMMAPGISYAGAVEVLRRGEVVTHPLTVPEGLTVPEVAAHIAEATGEAADSVLAMMEQPGMVDSLGVPGPTLEGYLMPETYRFAAGVSAAAVVRTMTEQHLAFWGPDELAQADSLGMDVREVVTLASIVQEEMYLAEEGPRIAGVFRNRLRIGMPLQADATVQYALQQAFGQRTERLLFGDIDAVEDHPYNTYTRAGLPPGPVASPGEAALRAALAPEDHQFLYFMAQVDGSHEFSRTLAEHNRAVARARAARPGG